MLQATCYYDLGEPDSDEEIELGAATSEISGLSAASDQDLDDDAAGGGADLTPPDGPDADYGELPESSPLESEPSPLEFEPLPLEPELSPIKPKPFPLEAPQAIPLVALPSENGGSDGAAAVTAAAADDIGEAPAATPSEASFPLPSENGDGGRATAAAAIAETVDGSPAESPASPASNGVLCCGGALPPAATEAEAADAAGGSSVAQDIVGMAGGSETGCAEGCDEPGLGKRIRRQPQWMSDERGADMDA